MIAVLRDDIEELSGETLLRSYLLLHERAAHLYDELVLADYVALLFFQIVQVDL